MPPKAFSILKAILGVIAPLALASLTGVPTAPTAAAATNTTQLATTAFVTAANTTNANLTGMVTSVGNTTSLGSFTSANLSGAVTDETGTGSAVFATSPTLVTPALGTPSALVGTNITGTAAGLTAGNVITNANLTGEVTSTGNATTLINSAVIGKVLTGFTSGAGVVSATDNILQSVQKLNGNDALKAPLASPSLTGVPTAPTAAAATNTTQLATTAFVTAAASSSNFVDLTTAQTIAGDKKFSSGIIVNGELIVGYGKGGDYTSVAVGAHAQSSNVIGTRNTAIGSFALKNNTASENTAIGYYTLEKNTTGISNVAVGGYAGYIITTGSQNTLLGSGTDPSSLDGFNQTVIGYNAKGAGNTAITDVKTSGKLTTGAITLPNTDGTAGQVLTTNGSGSISWGTAGANVIEVADEFTASASQTSFTLTQTPSVNSKVKMFVNGIRISNTAYSVTGATLTYNPANNGAYALSAGDRIQMDYYR